jgi:glucokinase
MAAMLEAAGVPSDGVPGALRQSGLMAIYQSVSQVFERDETADSSKTMAALDSRLKRAERWLQLFDKYVKRTQARTAEPARDEASA